MCRTMARTRLKTVLLCGVAGLLAACAQAPSDPVAVEAVEAAAPAPEPIWPPSEADEALYLERYEALVRAFQSGQATTTYDTLGPLRGAPADAVDIAFANAGLDPAFAAEITAFAEAANSRALIVYQNGEILHEAYFEGFDKDALIVGKSLAKPLGVVAVGAAIRAGHIESLDQPVADFFEPWREDGRSEILVRHLLDMRTGLLPQAQATTPEDILNRAYLHPKHDELIIQEYPLVETPGERYDYSNANAELVAPLIERATGVQYEDWLADEVLIPLDAAGGEIWMNRPGGTAHAGCCALLPARSWLKIAALLLNDGVWEGRRVLPEGFVDEMRTPTEQNIHSGMGVYIGSPYVERRGYLNPDIEIGKSFHSEPYVDDDLILFDGNSNQVVYMFPSRDLIVLRLGETPPKDAPWDNAYLPNLVARALDAAE